MFTLLLLLTVALLGTTGAMPTTRTSETTPTSGSTIEASCIHGENVSLRCEVAFKNGGSEYVFWQIPNELDIARNTLTINFQCEFPGETFCCQAFPSDETQCWTMVIPIQTTTEDSADTSTVEPPSQPPTEGSVDSSTVPTHTSSPETDYDTALSSDAIEPANFKLQLTLIAALTMLSLL